MSSLKKNFSVLGIAALFFVSLFVLSSYGIAHAQGELPPCHFGGWGCNFDTDGDGVTDDNDMCPNTPLGTPINTTTGCPLPDTDGDGVVDRDDRCPNTQRLTPVNNFGCPDSDGDGFYDNEDACPNAAASTGNGCPVQNPNPEPRCGDGRINGTETCTSCPSDAQFEASCQRPPGGPTPSPNPGLPGSPAGGSFDIKNPLSADDITGFLQKALQAFVQIMFPIIVVFFVISGLMFITARGNPAQLTTAKRALLFTIIGAAVILGAALLAKMLDETLKQVIGR